MPDCGIDLKQLPDAVDQSMARGRASPADAPLFLPLSAGSLSGPAPLIYIVDLRHTMFNSKIPGLITYYSVGTPTVNSHIHSTAYSTEPHFLINDYLDVDSSRLQLEVGGWASLLLAWPTDSTLTTRLLSMDANLLTCHTATHATLSA